MSAGQRASRCGCGTALASAAGVGIADGLGMLAGEAGRDGRPRLSAGLLGVVSSAGVSSARLLGVSAASVLLTEARASAVSATAAGGSSASTATGAVPAGSADSGSVTGGRRLGLRGRAGREPVIRPGRRWSRRARAAGCRSCLLLRHATLRMLIG